MTRPEDPFEALSYDLNKLRERRMAERRSEPRNTADRRKNASMTQSPPNGLRMDNGTAGKSS
jgi:hypothetical protein